MPPYAAWKKIAGEEMLFFVVPAIGNGSGTAVPAPVFCQPLCVVFPTNGTPGSRALKPPSARIVGAPPDAAMASKTLPYAPGQSTNANVFRPATPPSLDADCKMSAPGCDGEEASAYAITRRIAPALSVATSQLACTTFTGTMMRVTRNAWMGNVSVVSVGAIQAGNQSPEMYGTAGGAGPTAPVSPFGPCGPISP